MIKKILKAKLEAHGFRASSVRSLLNGTRKPSLEKAIELQTKRDIPVTAWQDIKSYIESVTEESNKDEVQIN